MSYELYSPIRTETCPCSGQVARVLEARGDSHTKRAGGLPGTLTGTPKKYESNGEAFSS